LEKLLTTEELTEILQVSRQTLFTWRNEGLPFMKINRAVRFDLEQVKKWLEGKGK